MPTSTILSRPTVPIWTKTAHGDSPTASPASPGGAVDVAVLGAGIAGLTTAYLLLKSGRSVTVYAQEPVADLAGGGETVRTSAHLSSVLDDGFATLAKQHGDDGVRVAYESHAAAIDLIEKIAADEKIECNFQRLDEYLFPADGKGDKELDDELAAAKKAGVNDVIKLGQCPLKNWSGGPCLKFGRQARFQPLSYLRGLAAAVEKHGGQLRLSARVEKAEGATDGKPASVSLADGETVNATAIACATNMPTLADWKGKFLKQATYRTYVLAVEAADVDNVLYTDMNDPYHYVRLADAPGGKTALLIGGGDHRVGQGPANEHEPFDQLRSWAEMKFKNLGPEIARWSGEVLEPADGLAFIGKAPIKGENVYVITGDSGMGLTHGSLGAIILSALVNGKESPWAKTYDPDRSTLTSEFVTENASTATKYAELLTPGDVSSTDQIPAGQGAVMREGLSKVAVYKAPDGTISKCSAICTHLKCVVDWNAVEASWDCPCHGSRFDAHGKVLFGPATKDLPKA